MTRVKDTAYPDFKAQIPSSELERNYSPTDEELAFVQGLVSGPAPQTAMMVHLKMLQVMGRMLKMPEVPQQIRDHVARCLTFARSPSLKELGRFERSGNRALKIKKLREFLDLRPLGEKGFAWLKHVAEQAAEVKHSVADIINVMLEELVRHRYELPAFSTLDRAAYNAREQSNEQYFNSISSKLGPRTKVMIDSLMRVEPGAQTSAWHSLKREPKKPTNKETRIYLQHIETLKRIVETLPKPEIPIPKMRQFRYLARALDAAEMAKLKPQKRYALAVVFIRSQYAQSLDDAALLFIKMLGNLENLARNKLLLHQEGRSEKVDALVELLMNVMQAYKIDGTADQRVDAIESTLPTEVDAVINECIEHLAFAGKNYLPFLAEPYKFVRAQLLNCLLIPRAAGRHGSARRARPDGLSVLLAGEVTARGADRLPLGWRDGACGGNAGARHRDDLGCRHLDLGCEPDRGGARRRQPTLTSRPGLPVRIIVNRDLVLRPYQPMFFQMRATR